MIDSEHTLELVINNKLIHSSNKSGLRPLMETINIIKEKYSTNKDIILNDKITGLAAAKLIIYCGQIAQINSELASKKAIELLLKSNTHIKAKTVVDKILNKDKTAQCHMELKSETLTPEEFYLELKRIINI